MKIIFGKYYWLFVVIGIIVNIFIFYFASQKLSEYVYGDIVLKQGINKL